MARRIVKRTYADGRSEYVIETNRIFGFIPIPWWMEEFDEDEFDPKIYYTLDEAMDALNSSTLVKSEVIKTRKQNTRGW